MIILEMLIKEKMLRNGIKVLNNFLNIKKVQGCSTCKMDLQRKFNNGRKLIEKRENGKMSNQSEIKTLL